MAKNYRNRAKARTRKKSKYTKAETLAYQLGQINRGLKNTNSKVYESYQKGLSNKKTKAKKPLY